MKWRDIIETIVILIASVTLAVIIFNLAGCASKPSQPGICMFCQVIENNKRIEEK